MTDAYYFPLQLNSDEFLNVDLILEETMHILIIGPLTSRLRESLLQNLSERNSQLSTKPIDSEDSQQEIIVISEHTRRAFNDCFVQMKASVSPLDKLAHLMTGLKVITNSVSLEKIPISLTMLYKKVKI